MRSILFGILALTVTITPVAANRKFQLSNVPSVGKTGVYNDESEKVLKIYYGDELKWHAAHIQTEGWNKPEIRLTIAKSAQERKNNRKEALKPIPLPKNAQQPGMVRDEKPCAVMHYRPTYTTTVWFVPRDESNLEGTLENEVKIQAGGFGTDKKLQFIDNRSDKTAPAFQPGPPSQGSSQSTSHSQNAGHSRREAVEDLHDIIRRSISAINAISLNERKSLAKRNIQLNRRLDAGLGVRQSKHAKQLNHNARRHANAELEN